MKNELINSFKQATLGSIIWVTLLITMSGSTEVVPLGYMWHIIGIGLLMGGVFGVIYPYLWKYATFKAYVNILLSSILNTMTGFLAVYLYSTTMYLQIKGFFTVVLIITLMGHTLGFYVYGKMQNVKLAQELNQLVK